MAKLREAQYRHATFQLQLVRAADTLFKQGGSALEDGLRLFQLNEPNIRAALEWGEGHFKYDDRTAEICNVFPNIGALLFELLYLPRERLRWLDCAREAARQLGDRQSEAWHIGNIGLVHLHMGNIESAIKCFQHASQLFRQFKDRAGEARSWGNLGLAYKEHGEIKWAIEAYENALLIVEEINDRRYMARILGNLGSAYSILGEYARAIEYYRDNYRIAEELGDLRGQAGALSNISLVYVATRDYPRALRFAQYFFGHQP
jgi:tetratricopeptide (TPR) repeat protein